MKLNNYRIGCLIILAFYIFTLYVNYKEINSNIYLSIGVVQILLYLFLCYFIGSTLAENQQSKMVLGIGIGVLIMLMTLAELAKMQVFHLLNS